MKKQTSKILLFITILSSHIGFSQNYLSEFENYFKNNDTINQLKTLIKWEKSTPKDAELFSSYFNYYFMKARKETVAFSNEQPEEESLALTDGLDQATKYLSSANYDKKEANKGFHKIEKGIELYPNRLDMRFGKIYALGQMSHWDAFTSEIIKTVKYSSKNNNNWAWTNNEKKENGKEDFFSSIQTYQLQLYTTENNNLLMNMQSIANEILKHYPNHIESLTNLSVTYLISGEFDKAIDTLNKALKIDSKNHILLSNIALGYKLKGNKEKAIEYYYKTLKYGNKVAKEFAEQQITELGY